MKTTHRTSTSPSAEARPAGQGAKAGEESPNAPETRSACGGSLTTRPASTSFAAADRTGAEAKAKEERFRAVSAPEISPAPDGSPTPTQHGSGARRNGGETP